MSCWREAIAVVLLLASGRLAGAQARSIDFTRQIQPILADNCYACHGPDSAKRKGELRWDSLDPKQGPFAPRDGYSIVVPGDLENSILISRITSDDADVKMPPPASKRSLTPEEIELIRQWVLQGAKWSKHWSLVAPVRPVPNPKDTAGARNEIDRFILDRLEKEGLKPSPEAPKETLIRRVTLDLTGLPPTLEEIDDFLGDESPDAYEKVVDRLLASPHYGEHMAWEWLTAARYADTNGYQNDPVRTMWPWRDWVVRAMNDNMPFDLFATRQIAGDLMHSATTEPVTAASQPIAFPSSPGAPGEDRNEGIVSKTRASASTGPALTLPSPGVPGEGVRAARTEPRPPSELAQIRNDKIATAFLRNHAINGEGGRIPEENRVDYVLDQTETVGTVFLGLTVGCARCHDHKFDPITQKDYYSLSAFFNNTPVTGADGSGQAKPVVDFATPEQLKRVAELDAEVKKIATEVLKIEQTIFPHSTTQTAADSPKAAGFSGNIIGALKLPPERRGTPVYAETISTFEDKEPAYVQAIQRLSDTIATRDKFNLTIPRVMVMEDMPTTRPTYVLVKGSYENHAEEVHANTPAALPPLDRSEKTNRLALARWLFSPEHPLTARVQVNRYWQRFFGTGLVKTLDDFGIQGERPSHPELLDWLAVEFRESGWDVKAMHRLLVTSSTYRQSSRVTPELLERDPENRLLARGPRYRLPSWVIRDQALAVSGLLVDKLGGSPVKPYQPPGIWEEATFGHIKYEQDHGDALYRRSLYTFWRRIVGPTEFFDTASRSSCTVRPLRTNSPLHALTTLNDTTYVEAARCLAQRVMTSDAETDRLDLAFRLVTGRNPMEAEQTVLSHALDRFKEQYAADKPAAIKLISVGESKRDERLNPADLAAYTSVCLEILNLDEAVSKE